MDGALPGGKVTFVATDVEGSTRLWGLDAGAMQEALARHDEILSDVFAVNEGKIFKHTGDGVFAVFDQPRFAAEAALEAQLRLCRERWPAPAILSVRMAVVTGEARPEGADYRGQALNRCARYLAVGHGGQILMSSSTAELLRALPQEAELLNLGEHLLRDLPEPEEIFRLVHPDLPVGPAALRSLAGARHNLPEEWSSFVGRSDELLELGRLLEMRRLVSLVGPPGCGKTRLAIQLGRVHLDDYPHGVWFVPLAHQTDPTLLVQSVGRKLGVVERPDRPYLDTIMERMQAGRILLILDNCEHLLGPCAALATQLLNGCHQLTVLTTSREALAVTGEQAWFLGGLQVPEAQETAGETDAVQLFVERARESDVGFDADSHQREIREVCIQLDGLPLAIELAAARLRSLTIGDLTRHLSDRFRLLVGGTPTAAPHQQTLHDTIDWSYQLLDPREQRAFDRLTVFAKGFDLAAASAVLGEDSEADVIEVLSRLVEKSLVGADRSGTTVRYSMLETIRAFGMAMLEASGEKLAVRRLHALHFLELAENGDRHLRGANQLMWLARLEQERSNLRAGWEWTLADQPDWAYRFACALAWFWSLRGGWHEGRARFERVLALSGNNRLLEARAQVCRAELEVDSGSPEDGTSAMISEAREICRELGDSVGLGRLELAEAKLAAHRDLVDTVVDLASSAAQTLDTETEPWHAAQALIVLGEAQFFAAGVDAAEPCFAAALERFRALGDRWGMSGALKYQGEMVGLKGHPQRAVKLIEESLVLARQMGDQGSLVGSVASSEVFLGRTLCRLGRYAASRASLERAIDIYRISGNQLGLGWAMANLGHIDLQSGDWSSARHLIRQSYGLTHSMGFAQGVAWIELNLAHLLLHEGDLRRARELATRSLIADEYRGDRRAVADSRSLLGRIALEADELEEAEDHLQASLEALTSLAITAFVPGVLEGLAKVAVARHDLERAAGFLNRADQIRKEMQTPVPLCDRATNRATREALALAGE
jgi:predicted ATPase/class 3 adenylate cyclase